MNCFDIFISYSSKDKSVADQLITQIEKAGFSCWIAPRNIEGGAEYSEIIEKAILDCKIFLLVFSENSEKSPWVKSELNVAFSENKYLIPYRIDTTPLKGTMRLLLNDKHWIAKNVDENKQIELLLSAIQNYFTMLEKGKIEDISENPYYKDIAKQKMKKNILWGSLLFAFCVVTGIILFAIFSGSNRKNIKKYNNAVEQAFSIQETSVNDMITKRNLLHFAKEVENEIPVSQRKDISETLFLITFKLDSIYLHNLDLARMFSGLETASGDKQAIECYRLALQTKEDSIARKELTVVLSRQGTYE